MNKQYNLLLVDGAVVIKKIPLEEKQYSIGRADDCGIVLSSKDVSRRHAVITNEGSQYFVEDLDSTNGTFVNGQRVTKAALQPGDEISVGDYTFCFDDGSTPYSCPDETVVGRKGAETVIIEDKFSSLREKLKDNDLAAEFKTIEDMVKRSRKRLSSLANEDKLTGLYNRQHFDKVSKSEFSNVKKTGQPLSVLFVDIDHFKKVNDTYGHKKGDEVLKVVSQLVQISCRKSDFVARYGGEEIVVLLPNTVSRDAVKVAKDINTIIKKQTVRLVAIPVTVSIGVATYPGDGSSIAGVIDCADKALYQAKSAGRNRVFKYDEKRH
jgi:diguanylate cyclase (GGDEF)-like protein